MSYTDLSFGGRVMPTSEAVAMSPHLILRQIIALPLSLKGAPPNHENFRRATDVKPPVAQTTARAEIGNASVAPRQKILLATAVSA